VTGKRIEISDSPMGAPVGDAILAGVGVGAFSSWTEPLALTIGASKSYEPRPEYDARYKALYEIYRGLYPSLAPHYKRLAEVP
jgi:sugar (pentulose or hexulose) kinase